MVLSVWGSFPFCPLACCQVHACPACPGGDLVFPLEGQVALPEQEPGLPALVTALGARVALLIPVNSPVPVQRIGLEIVLRPCTSSSETNSSSFWENSSSLEKELKSEKEQRQALQRELQQEKDTSSLLRAELQQVEGLTKVRQPSQGGKSCWAAAGISRSLCSRRLMRAQRPLRERCCGENKTGRRPAVAVVVREACQGG